MEARLEPVLGFRHHGREREEWRELVDPSTADDLEARQGSPY
jgi:hypothetical protein